MVRLSFAWLAISSENGRSFVCRPYDNQLRFRKADLDKIPEHVIGVYGFWFKRRCIYVGKAEDQTLAERLKQHWNNWPGTHNDDLSNWIRAKGSELRVAFLVVEDKSRVGCLERFYIRRFQPVANRIFYGK